MVKIPPKIKKERGPDIPPIFETTYTYIQNPRNGAELKRLILETGDWVNIVALTKKSELVVVRQYRAGTDTITSETPGGIIDPGDDSLTGAKRELLEETGYASDKWTYLGSVAVNPAIMNNACHHWLAKNAYKLSEPDLDVGEDIAVELFSVSRLQEEIEAGTFCHSLALSGLSRVSELWSKLKFELFSSPAGT